MSKWVKKGKYYAVNGSYTMSWNDDKKFILYYKKDFVVNGTRAKCLKAFEGHKPVQEQTDKEWLKDHNKKIRQREIDDMGL